MRNRANIDILSDWLELPISKNQSLLESQFVLKTMNSPATVHNEFPSWCGDVREIHVLLVAVIDKFGGALCSGPLNRLSDLLAWVSHAVRVSRQILTRGVDTGIGNVSSLRRQVVFLNDLLKYYLRTPIGFIDYVD